MLRLFEPRITVMPRDGRWPKCLRVESELGESRQAFLTFGALADTTIFPGPSAELLFAPLEAVDFPVDAVFSARHISNEKAVAMVRRGLVDADNIFEEESHGDHGPSARGRQAPAAGARARVEAHRARAHAACCAPRSRSPSAPPLARSSSSASQRLRREYGTAPKLLRPRDLQLKLFVGHLPGQLSPVPATTTACCSGAVRGDGADRHHARRHQGRPRDREDAQRRRAARPVRPHRGLPLRAPAVGAVRRHARARARRCCCST